MADNQFAEGSMSDKGQSKHRRVLRTNCALKLTKVLQPFGALGKLPREEVQIDQGFSRRHAPHTT